MSCYFGENRLQMAIIFCQLFTTSIGRSCRKVRRRIVLEKEAFNKKKDLMQKSLNLHLRKRLAKVFVWSIMLYGSETWTLQKEDIRRLEAFEMWIWRRMMKVLWTEHKTNEELLQMVDAEREMMDTLRSRQKRWLGHILRHDSLLRITLEGRTQGGKGCGRPRTMFVDWL